MKRQTLRRRSSRLMYKRLLIAGALGLAVFIIVNVALWAVYRNRTYPGSIVMGVSIGSISYDSLSNKMEQLPLPTNLNLVLDEQKVTASLAELGVDNYADRTVQSANQQRSWLPLLNLFRRPELLAPARVQQTALDKKAREFAKTFRKDAVNAHLTLSGTTVSIAEGQAGYELAADKLGAAILRNLDKGKTTVTIPIRTTQPTVQAAALSPEKQKLEAQLGARVTYRYGNKTKHVTTAELAGWFVPSGEVYALAPDHIQAYIMQAGKAFGIRVKDAPGVAAATLQAVSSGENPDITLVRQVASKTYLYCIGSKGVDATHMPVFRNKLASTLNDSRGWSLDGLVEFEEAGSGCNFTVWLSAAELVRSFGGVCDAAWSCRVGANVVINFTRWQNASEAWNAAQGALDEYRNMVINHETGHWLGFGHSHCSGPGQPAPVMQQQSIDLEGCAFNAWPTARELATLRSQLGL